MNTKTVKLVIKRRSSEISEDIDHGISFGREKGKKTVKINGRSFDGEFRDENKHLSSIKNGTAPYMFTPTNDNTVEMYVRDSTNPVRIVSKNIEFKNGSVMIDEDTEIRIGEYILEIRVKYPIQQEEESMSMKSLSDDMDQSKTQDQDESQDMGMGIGI